MKQYIIVTLFFATFLFGVSCTKDEIYLYNTQNTPDLSNPIIQKMTNIVWYPEGGSVVDNWSTRNNIYKPSDYASSLLYNAAWTNLTLYRDGTSNMVFVPPMLINTVIHCKGNWQVSTEEENTIILSTKTPVSSVTGKIKILDLEAKENISTAKISLDFGDRLLSLRLVNDNSITQTSAIGMATQYSWIAEQAILTEPLEESDFIGTWATPPSTITDPNRQTIAEDITGIIYIEDLLANTPAFSRGLTFHLQKEGKAQIVYTAGGTSGIIFSYEMGLTENVFSDAKWWVKGNKIFIETNEELFYSIGESMFRFAPHVTNTTLLGYTSAEKYYTPIRIRPNQYSFEIIERTDKGFWTRVTTRTEIFYAFLSKTTFDENNTLNIKDVFKK